MRPSLLPKPQEATARETCTSCYGDGGDEDGRCSSCGGVGWVITTDPEMAETLKRAHVAAQAGRFGEH